MIERGGRLDFDAMQMRLHPAESRVRKLSAEIPAQFVAFDVLLWKGKPVQAALEKRRRRSKSCRSRSRPQLGPPRRQPGSSSSMPPAWTA